MTSDKFRTISSSTPLRIVYIVWGLALLGASNVFGQIETQEASLIEDGAYLAICEDEKFLKLGSLTFDSCVAEARNYTNQCWVHLNSVVGTGKELSNGTDHHRSKQQHANILWLFARCIQSSILLPHTVPSKETQIELTDAPRNSGAEPVGLESIIKESALIYANIQESLMKMQEMLSASGHEAIFKIGRDKVGAVNRENNILTNAQPDAAEMWVRLFSTSNLQSVRRFGSEYRFKYAPAISASAHTFDLIFIHTPGDMLEVCHPDYTELSCGSCDAYVEDGVVARITWFSNEILQETGNIDVSNIDDLNIQDLPQSIIMKCWAEGMEQLGYDPSELGPWINQSHLTQFRWTRY